MTASTVSTNQLSSSSGTRGRSSLALLASGLQTKPKSSQKGDTQHGIHVITLSCDQTVHACAPVDDARRSSEEAVGCSKPTRRASLPNAMSTQAVLEQKNAAPISEPSLEAVLLKGKTAALNLGTQQRAPLDSSSSHVPCAIVMQAKIATVMHARVCVVQLTPKKNCAQIGLFGLFSRLAIDLVVCTGVKGYMEKGMSATVHCDGNF